ncbi:MAG: restriction endonuclease subunit S [Saprospiraceae bacterium]|nr:restriction endonuclease subunit S [Saprospiraceae bacterium]MBK7736464.1 restriction endonuclease subunit S [Saprospiraceae bacterium]MBK7912171.1 restriction endonuclease subunit S [Saprospiraceae bacterium]
MTWRKKKLGDILTIERGGSPRPIDKYLTNSPDGINWIKISDATASTKYIYETKEKITKDGLHKTRLVNEGDFILSNSMSFGRPYIMKTTGCIHDGWLVLKQNGSKVFDTEFLYYLLSSPYVFKQFDYLAAGSTVRNLNIALVSSVEVPLPPLPEQQRIVSILDECFAAIDKVKANAEHNLLNANELFENAAQAIFTQKGTDWEQKLLGEFATFRNGINYTKGSKGEKIKIVGVKDFQDSYWVPDNDLVEVSLDGKINETDLLKKGDILAVRSNGNPQLIGRTLLAGKINEKVSHSGFTIRIRLDSKIVNPNYLCHFLKIQQTRKTLVESGNGVGIRSLNQGSLSSLKIPFPKSLKEQEMIIDKVDSIAEQSQKLKDIYQRKINDLEELKKSILQKAFAGELKTEKAVAV